MALGRFERKNETKRTKLRCESEGQGRGGPLRQKKKKKKSAERRERRERREKRERNSWAVDESCKGTKKISEDIYFIFAVFAYPAPFDRARIGFFSA